MKYTPHPYQERAIKFMLQNPCAGLFMDPGLGKTSITLAAVSILLQKKILQHVLVVAPLRVVYSVWPQEVEKWDQFRHLSIGIMHGPKKEKVLNEDYDIYVMNPEGLLWLRDTGRYKEFDGLVVDESTKFKHTRTRRFKAMRHILPHFDRRYILTGTPAPNGLLDLFGQVFLLDGGEALGKYVSHYRSQYFEQLNGGYVWVPREGAKQEIHRKIAPLVMRLDQHDYLEMPHQKVTEIWVDMPEKAKKQYTQLEKTFVTQLEAGEIVAANAAVASHKLRQIASGGVYVDGPDGERIAEHVHDAKTEACKDLVEQFQGQPTIIAYDTHHDLDRLRKAFGKGLPFIGGGVSAKRGDQLASLWNQGELPILALHPASAAHGLNLQHGGCHCIWYTLTWDLEQYEQLIRRVWRQGQERNVVFIYHILARGTIDQVVGKRLQKKDAAQRSLLDSLREYYLPEVQVHGVDAANKNFMLEDERGSNAQQEQ